MSACSFCQHHVKSVFCSTSPQQGCSSCQPHELLDELLHACVCDYPRSCLSRWHTCSTVEYRYKFPQPVLPLATVHGRCSCCRYSQIKFLSFLSSSGRDALYLQHSFIHCALTRATDKGMLHRRTYYCRCVILLCSCHQYASASLRDMAETKPSWVWTSA